MRRLRHVTGGSVTGRRPFLLGMLAVTAASIGASRADERPIGEQLAAALDKMFRGPHPGARAIRAKGVACRGTFTPDPAAEILSAAPHFQGGPYPVIVRFSDFSGIPSQADGTPGTNPVGIAIKFLLPGGIDTDLLGHAYDGFPAGTAEEFLGYLEAVGSGDAARRDAFLAKHAAARRFFDAAKSTPVSYAMVPYYGVNAFRFTNAAAVSQMARYQIRPDAGEQFLTAAEAEQLAPDYLREELSRRLSHGAVSFHLWAQLAAPGDDVTNGSLPWPQDRPKIALGRLRVSALADENDEAIRTLFFTPMNLVPGISASGDPLLTARIRAYAESYRRRTDGEQ
jgi:catalase